MKHNIKIIGYSYQLRPIEIKDAQFILDVRLEDKERNQFVHEIPNDVKIQENWLNKYFNTPNDYYFVVENILTGEKEGLISIYNINNNIAEWGRWVIKKGSMAAIESVALIYKVAFENLNLDELYTKTVEDNVQVVNFHKAINAKFRKIHEKEFELNGKEYNAVEQYVDKEYYFEFIRNNLEQKSIKVFQRNLKQLNNMPKMINIVIPMAGASSRFKILGYDKPKPFIKFEKKMMIEHVLECFKKLNAKFILVIQEKFLENQKEEIQYLKNNYSIEFVTVPKLTMGAAITALAAHKAINERFDIIFADSDNIFNQDDIVKFVDSVRERNLDGALLTINSNKACYSYVQINENSLLIQTKEKEVISNHAVCGIYYFRKLNQFKDAVIDLVVEADLSKGEFYMSNVYNHLLKSTENIGIFDINEFACVGTPEQLQQYIKDKISARV